MLKLDGKVALITGGSKGIGFATAKLFAQEGAKVIITGRNIDDLKDAADKISGNVTYIKSDTALSSDISALFKEIEKKFSKLDIAFINAGIADGGHIENVSEESFDKQIDINFKGAFFTAKNAIPYLAKNSSVIFMSSVSAGMGIENLSVYTATKAALVSLAKTLAADLVSKGIRVNSISPGFIWTPLGERNNKDNYEAICKSIPLENRFGTSDEIAQVGLFLASNMSSYITGQDFIVDGGLSTITRANEMIK